MIFNEKILSRPITIIMIFLLFVIFGIISFFKLPLSLLPEQKTPWVSIIIEYPGVSPQKIESLITKPIEEKIATIPGIRRIESISEEGKSRINVQFDINKDINFAILDLRENVDIVKATFPREVQEPQIIKYDPSQSPVLIVSLSSKKLNIQKLREIAEIKFKKIFQRIDGVSEIFISGGLQREIHVDIDFNKLLARNIDVQTVFREIQFANINLSSGMIYKNQNLISLITPLKYTSIEQIGNTTVVVPTSGKLIKVKDFAVVKDTHKERDSIARVDLKQKVSIYIQKSGIANTVKVVKNIKYEINKLRKEYSDINFDIVYNQAKFIKDALSQVEKAVIIGAFFAALVLLIFLKSVKATFIISLSIPVSIIATFAFLYLKKMSLNIFSLSGLAIASGMLVDNSIVVLENIFSKKNISEAVFSVEKPVIASTLTSIAVFLPIVFINKEVQLMYGDITFAIIFSLIFSLFTALLLLPVISNLLFQYKFSKLNKKIKSFSKIKVKVLEFFNSYKNNLKLLFKIKSILTRETYLKLLTKCLENYKAVLLAGIFIILSGFLLLPYIPQEYINPLDSEHINVFVELPSGTNLKETDKKVKKVETILYKNFKNSIKRISTRVEKAHSTIVIELKKDKDILIKDFIKRAKKLTGNIKNTDVIFSEPSGSSQFSKNEINIDILGEDQNRLRLLAHSLAKYLNSIKYITEIIFHFKDPQDQISIIIDKEKAALYNLNSNRIANYLRELIYGPVSTKFFDKDREIDVRVKLDKKYLKNFTDLKNIFIKNNNGILIPLTSISKIIKTKASSKIYRLNKHRSVSFSLKYDDIDLNSMVNLLKDKLKNYPLPKNYYLEFGENYKKMVKNRKQMSLAIVLALVLVYMILSSIFENFIYPLIIILSIPLAIASVFLTFFFTHTALNIAVYIGLIMLAGIVVNNGIILIDETNNLLEKRYKIRDALLNASASRLRPILMTTLTTILGLLPVLLNNGEGSNLWYSLALTIISGLFFSTLLTLFIIPAFYLLIFKMKLRRYF